jgi:hypothetical protein
MGIENDAQILEEVCLPDCDPQLLGTGLSRSLARIPLLAPRTITTCRGAGADG